MKSLINEVKTKCCVGAGLIAVSTGAITGLDCNRVNKKPEQKKYNILFIAVDDLRPELGCYGNSYVKSPNIDKLGSSGIVFTHTYCQQAVSNPSRASLLTGLRPDSTKVWDLFTPFRNALPNIIALPQYFKMNGYHSVGIGKIYHNNIPDSASWDESLHIKGFPFDPDAVYLTDENIKLCEEKKQRIIEKGEAKKHIDPLGEWYIKTVATEIADVPDNAYYDGAQTDVAIQELQKLKSANKLFFFGVGYYRPHLPFNAPRKYWNMYDRNSIPMADNDFLPKDMPPMAMNNMREILGYTDFTGLPDAFHGHFPTDKARLLKHGYLASVSYTDAQVGRLLDELKRLGLEENTIVILWGDNGWKLGEHNSWDKQTNYEIDAQIPMIIRVPGAKSNGRKCDALVELVDIYPTLCDLTGLPIPKYLQGTSYAPLLENADLKWKPAAFSQFLRGRYHPEPGEKQYMGYTMRTERYRYVEWYEWNKDTKRPENKLANELYDHQTDPKENVNVANKPENKKLTEQLSLQLHKGWKAAIPESEMVK